MVLLCHASIELIDIAFTHRPCLRTWLAGLLTGLLCVLLLQIRILEESGQLPLAYVAAASHGFEEEAARLREVRHPGSQGCVTLPMFTQLLGISSRVWSDSTPHFRCCRRIKLPVCCYMI
jgi:hypothetical protein